MFCEIESNFKSVQVFFIHPVYRMYKNCTANSAKFLKALCKHGYSWVLLLSVEVIPLLLNET